MDGRRLEALSRRLAGGPSRRAVLGGLGVLLAARTLGSAPPAEAVAGDEGWVEDEALGGLCRLPGFPCGNDGQCCAGGCQEGVCGCRNRGRRAWRAAICCSGKKKRGNKGTCR